MQQKYFIVSHISGDGIFWHELVKMNMIWYNEMSLLSKKGEHLYARYSCTPKTKYVLSNTWSKVCTASAL